MMTTTRSLTHDYIDILRGYFGELGHRTTSSEMVASVVRGLDKTLLDLYLKADIDITATCQSFNKDIVSLLLERGLYDQEIIELFLQFKKTYKLRRLDKKKYASMINSFCELHLGGSGKLSNRNLMLLFTINTSYILYSKGKTV